MENVPWHTEVVNFVKKLADLLPDYEIASEHEHSNCVMLANKNKVRTFLINLNNSICWFGLNMFY